MPAQPSPFANIMPIDPNLSEDRRVVLKTIHDLLVRPTTRITMTRDSISSVPSMEGYETWVPSRLSVLIEEEGATTRHTATIDVDQLIYFLYLLCEEVAPIGLVESVLRQSTSTERPMNDPHLQSIVVRFASILLASSGR